MEDLPRKANKGEWAELYVFFKIALDKIIYAANKDLELKRDEYYEFIKLFRQSRTEGLLEYDLTEEDTIRVVSASSQPIVVIEKSELREKTRRIFERIKSANSTFAVEDAVDLMDTYHLTSVKSPSSSKADIEALVRTAGSPTLHKTGFSIKSYIGGAPTLVNSSLHTNFIYEIVDFRGNIDEINAIDTRSKVRDRISSIRENGGTLKFQNMQSETYKGNLRMQDSSYPSVMARMLQYFYEGNGYELEVLGAMVAADSDIDATDEEVRYKTKNFLRSSALGMVPATIWDTRLTTQGGYIVLFGSGDLACYSLYYDDDFRDYLYSNTRFDTPSTTKYDYGYIYEENDKLFIKLNLQIRFKKP